MLALGIGVAAGTGSVLFRELLALVQEFAFGDGSERLFAVTQGLRWWEIVLPPTIGGLCVGLYVHFLLRGRHPNGVAQVMEASAIRGGRMSLSRGIHGALVNAFSLGVGASAGREGPVVHLGASIGAWVAKRLHLDRGLTRTLLACGIAAAVAASFNAPLAGVFFALEVVIGHYALRAFAPLVISSVIATVISRWEYGNYPAFIIPGYHISSVLEFPAFILLGITSALVAIVFMRSIAFAQDTARRSPIPGWARPMVGGFAVGLIALAFPQVLGVGYGATDDALNALFPFWMMAALVVAKIAATAITLGSGFGGGMFSPSLFVGAMVGGAFGIVAGEIAPTMFAGEGAYSMVGMGAVAGSILGAPISTILIIFELTGDYELTTAVMVGTVTAAIVTYQLHGTSYFRWMLKREGVDVDRRHEVDILRTVRVNTVMRPQFASVPRAMGLAQLRLLLQTAPYGELFVIGDDGKLYGTITLADLSEAAFDHTLDDLVNAGDVARLNPPMLEAADNLETAIAVMEEADEEHIAVVDSRSSRKLVGFVHERDVMFAYNRELVRVHREEGAAY